MEVDREPSDNESSSGDEEEMELEKQVTELETVVSYTLLFLLRIYCLTEFYMKVVHITH